MNKNVKKIVAMALAIGIVSAVAPVTNVNILTTKAYASNDENNETTLDSLKLKTSSGSALKLYSNSNYDSDSRLDEDDTPDEDTYYAKTSSSTVNVDIDGPDSDYVRVFKGTSDSTKGKKISNDIDLSSGTNTLVVRVYGSEPDSSIKYEEDDDVKSEYKIKVKYDGNDSNVSDNEDDSEDYDDIYLDKLTIAGESIPLSESKVKYTYNVASNVDEVTIKAEPDYDHYTVRIDGTEVDDGDKYKRTVSLANGENKIEVKIEDEDNDDKRVYTLNITRGTTFSTGTSTETKATTQSTETNVVTTATKTNQWVQINGEWQYNDSTGNAIKNSWVTDKNLGKEYYLQFNGSMATEWLKNNGRWYYLGKNGAKKTGWQSVNGVWYYLDSQGIMQTGWMKDVNGKYYYLNSNGSMASNTTIAGYNLGADGAWTGR